MPILDRLRALPLYSQVVVFVLVAVGLIVVGEMGWPVKAKRDEKAALELDYAKLTQLVSRLENVKRQHQDLLTNLESLRKELASVRLIVPEEKKTDEFMRMLQRATVNSRIGLRRLTAGAVVIKEYYAEMPFEIALDGPYYNVLEFFRRLGGATRIVNAAGVRLTGLDPSRGRYQYLPGTTVEGVCTVITFYTPSEAEIAAAAPPGQAAGGRPGPASAPR